MTFAHPLMLLGMLSAAIPLLVHLFDRRRPRVVPFGALSFVLKSEKRTASRLKLKRLLLYLLRWRAAGRSSACGARWSWPGFGGHDRPAMVPLSRSSIWSGRFVAGGGPYRHSLWSTQRDHSCSSPHHS